MNIIEEISAYRQGNDASERKFSFWKNFSIKEEIIEYSSRLITTFYDSTGEERDIYRLFKGQTTLLSIPIFTENELLLLVENFELEYDYKKKKVINSLHHLYDIGQVGYTCLGDVNYMIVYFNRWEHESQPRGVGEDQLGENVTYIHGIWENVNLPKSLINKIK